jgi:hypothetical protein
MASVSILISSFDGFSDCWGPVCHGFSRYWSDCPYPIYLITNQKPFLCENVNIIRLGQDYGWTRNLKLALAQIDSTYIIYFQEDYWINEKVNSVAINEYLSIMDEQHLNYLRLLAHPVPDHEFSDDERLGILATDAPYRTALQAAIWRKDVLLDLLNVDESPWQFEVQGTIRSQKYERTFLSVKKHEDDPYYYGIRYVCTAINQGRWARMAKEYAMCEGLVVDWGNLPSETWWHEFRRKNKLGAWTHLMLYRIRLITRHPVIAYRKLHNKLLGAVTPEKQSNRGRDAHV